MDLAGKVVWLTGASSGIGAALAVALSRRGARLILSARTEEKLAAVKAACECEDKNNLDNDNDNGNGIAPSEACRILPLDLSHLDSLPEKAASATALFGTIDLLINNGGVGQRGFAEATDFSVVQRILDVNFLAAVQLTQAVLPAMLERGVGHIVVTSSVLGKVGIKNRSAYCASKHALHGYFDSLRAETHNRGIRVTLICPGYVHTNISVTAHTADGSPHGRVDAGQTKGITAEVCAARMVKAIKHEKEEANIGGLEVFGVNIKRFLPSLYSRIARRLKVE